MKINSEVLAGMKDVDINRRRVVYTDHNGIRMYRTIHEDGRALSIPFLYLGEESIDEREENAISDWFSSFIGKLNQANKDNDYDTYYGLEKIAPEEEEEETNPRNFVECDIQRDRAWNSQYYCSIHGVWFRSFDEPELCPVGEAYINGYEDAKK